MADDFVPTVVQQTIPPADITPLELLLLSDIFSVQKDDDGYYFYTDLGPSDIVWATGAELRQAMADRPHPESAAHRMVAALLEEASNDDDEVEIDLVDIGWPALFQDVVQRSATLPYVTCLMAFTSSRLSPDSLGGQAFLITANEVRSKSTFNLLDDFIKEATAVPRSPDTVVPAQILDCEALPPSPEKPTLFAAAYEHKYGTDVRVFRSEDQADAWRTEIAKEWWDSEFREDERPADSDIGAAYFDRMRDGGEEFFSVNACELE